MAASPVDRLRLILMLRAALSGPGAAVDRLADTDDAGVMRIARMANGGRTFASAHQEGEEWETGGRYYKREGGETHRVANPNASDAGTGGSSTERTAAPAPQPKAAPEPQPEPDNGPVSETGTADRSPEAFEKVVGESADRPDSERAATIASWIVAPVFPETRARVEEGLAQFFGGDHDIGKIITEQANKLAGDKAAPSVERAVAGVVSDLIGGEKPFSESLRDRLEPVRQSFEGDNLKINAIQATTMGLAIAINYAAPGVGSIIGGAVDEIASQVIEKRETDWRKIAIAAAREATLGVVTRRIGALGKKGGAKLAGRASKVVTAKTGSGLAGEVAAKIAEAAADASAKRVNRAIENKVRGGPAPYEGT